MKSRKSIEQTGLKPIGELLFTQVATMKATSNNEIRCEHCGQVPQPPNCLGTDGICMGCSGIKNLRNRQ